MDKWLYLNFNLSILGNVCFVCKGGFCFLVTMLLSHWLAWCILKGQFVRFDAICLVLWSGFLNACVNKLSSALFSGRMWPLPWHFRNLAGRPGKKVASESRVRVCVEMWKKKKSKKKVWCFTWLPVWVCWGRPCSTQIRIRQTNSKLTMN